MTVLPPISELQHLNTDQKNDTIAQLFEPCPTLEALVMPLVDSEQPSYPVLIERIREVLMNLSPKDPKSPEIVGAHPRLGAKKVDSAQSRAEQVSLNNDASPEIAHKLYELNEKYEETFPGLRYVVFVAGRPRSEIIQDMQARISEHNYELEVKRAFNAMCDIALDRYKRLAACK